MESVRGPTRQKRLGIVYPAPYFDLSPSLFSLATFFCQRGFGIDLYTVSIPAQSANALSGMGVQVHELFLLKRAASARLKSGAGGSHPSQGGKKGIFNSAKKIFYALSSLELASRLVMNQPKKLKALIGVDLKGLSLAASAASFLKVPFFYYSLELFPSRDLKTREEWELKRREVELSRKALCTITQDEARKEILARDNGLSPEKIICIPNAFPRRLRHRRSEGSLQRDPSLRSFQERFQLPPRARIALYAGSLARWAGVKELVRAAVHFPEPWVLVLHSYGDRLHKREERLLEAEAPRNRVFFSWDPVSLEEFRELLASAHVGIAFYFPEKGAFTAENVRSVGLSSGKAASYLWAELPVIVNEGTTLSQFVRQTGCGVCVESPSKIGEALAKIDESYPLFQKRATAAFLEHWDPTPGLQLLCEQIERA